MKRRITPLLRPRRTERIDVALPVHLASGIGLTRNVSAEGVYFEMDSAAEIGSEITLEVDMKTPFGKMVLKCSGLVVRTEAKGNRSGIAVHIVESRLEAAEN